MSRHHTEDIEALAVALSEDALEAKDAPGRYRAEVRHRRGWLWEVDVVTTHVILPVIKRVKDDVEYGEPVHGESRLERPPAVLGERWAGWKARRMVAAAHRKDVREQQPWAVQR